jgi:transcriptional regulator with XRE-family HTH domain
MKEKSNDIFLASLGRRIQSLRKSKKLTQQKLGERSEINYKYIGEIERGVQNPTVSLLKSIAEGLEVEILDLFLLDYEIVQSRDEIIGSIVEQLGSFSDEKLKQILFILKNII